MTAQEHLAPAPPSAWTSFRALLLRDLTVIDKELWQFLPRTIIQPLLIVFVLTYVFAKLSLAAAPRPSGAFAAVLLAGIVTLAIFLQALQAVAFPFVHELGVTREIEDRVLAPVPLTLIAVEKIVVGAFHGLLAACMVFPMASVIPAVPITLDVRWPVLLTILPLACLTTAAGGLALASLLDPRYLATTYTLVLFPSSLLGGIFFSWQSLDAIPWLKYAVLVNPTIYMSEGMRAGLVGQVPHMPLPVVYGVLMAAATLLSFLGVRGFRRRVLL